MKVILCVTRDLVTGDTTTAPMMSRNEVDAERSWANAIQMVAKDPSVPVKDFQLYKIADFDTETLQITPDVKFLHNAQEFLFADNTKIEKVEPEKVEEKQVVSEVVSGIHDDV